MLASEVFPVGNAMRLATAQLGRKRNSAKTVQDFGLISK
jgi:hypothetical protein